MTKPLQVAWLVVTGAVAVDAAGPAIARLTSALVPLIAVVAIAAAVVRAVWWYTR